VSVGSPLLRVTINHSPRTCRVASADDPLRVSAILGGLRPWANHVVLDARNVHGGPHGGEVLEWAACSRVASGSWNQSWNQLQDTVAPVDAGDPPNAPVGHQGHYSGWGGPASGGGSAGSNPAGGATSDLGLRLLPTIRQCYLPVSWGPPWRELNPRTPAPRILCTCLGPQPRTPHTVPRLRTGRRSRSRLDVAS
jgi:hypothetical protein